MNEENSNTHHKNGQRRSERRHVFLTVLNLILTLCMVVITSFLVYWTSKLWEAADQQAKAAKAQVTVANEQVKLMGSMNEDTKSLTKETIKYAKEQAEAASKSVEASKSSAEAAKQAVIISEKALKRTEEMFSVENRPYLVISSSPFDDQSYYLARLNQRNKSFEVSFQYEIKNIGKLAATDIVFYSESKITDRISGETSKSLDNKISACPINPFTKTPAEFTIAPGETLYILIIGQLPDIPDTIAEELVETFDTMVQESGLGVKITAEYKNEIDKATIIRVSKSYKVFKKRAYTVGSTEPKP